MDLSSDAWTFLGLLVGQSVIIIVAVINNRSTKQKVAEVQQTAQEAVDHAKPTGNGFAWKTLGSLDRIESLLAELKADVRAQGDRLDRHLEQHVERAEVRPHRRWRRP